MNEYSELVAEIEADGELADVVEAIAVVYGLEPLEAE